ncbi:O-antigen ligase family protein [Hydrogenophaga sp. UC242_50]|uniref:O-antigen ligase family protein n=1 Tax=unclassified Hydrogenophaga TaxID=2610897 RepID=UPI0036D43F05
MARPRSGALILGALAALTCLGLAVQHPLAPALLVGALCLCMGAAAWRPWTIGGLLAMLLPVASLAPSTGWWLIDEFDLLVLAVLAGAHARSGFEAFSGRAASSSSSETQFKADRVWVGLLVALGASALLSLFIGLRDAGVSARAVAAGWASGDGWLQALHADYASAFNPLRVSKSLLWALLLYPVLRRVPVERQREMARFTLAGLLCGLAWVCVLVLWERGRYVGVLNFSDSYRTVANFWEMHVGGGAIDAYLAMAVPLAFWAVWLAPGGWRWACAAVLAVLGTYAVLTTYSRGLYLAVTVSLMVMAIVARRCQIQPASGGQRRGWALRVLVFALLAEAVWVLGGHSFMTGRLAQSETDLVDRVAHWQSGLGLLRTPADWVLGLGAGRLPAHYSARVPDGEFPGQARWRRDAAGAGQVVLSGPPTRQEAAYDFGLTQRIPLAPQGHYRVRVRYETDAPVVLLFSVCERHLLYDFRCQWKHVRPEAAVTDAAQWHDIPLSGQVFSDASRAVSWRDGMFALTVLSTGHAARIHAVELLDPQGVQILKNADFSAGLRYWFPAAQSSFKPWHMDNLYLEILIERGLLGWLVLGLLAAWAWRCVAQGLKAGDPLALALAGSLSAMGVLGLVISVTELPRIAFMLLLILLTTSHFRRIPQYSRYVTERQKGVSAVFSDGRPSRAQPPGPLQEKEV